VAAAGITKKLLQREGKRMIRLLAIQTGAPMRVRQLLPSAQHAQHPVNPELTVADTSSAHIVSAISCWSSQPQFLV
jgi:hypothetical protein